MKVTVKQYQQSLVNSPKYYTCDYIGEYLETSGDSVERLLKEKKLQPNLIWETQKDNIVLSTNGGIIIDKTVLEHKNSKKIEIAKYQYSGQSHGVKMGIGVINLVYYNPDIDQYWLIDYRIWNGGKNSTDKTTELDYARDLLKTAINRGITFSSVYVDGFYASSQFLTYIALDLGKIFYTNLSSNNKCSEFDSNNTNKLTSIKDMEFSDQELQNGKIVRLNKTPKTLKVKLFQIAIQDNRIENLVTNNLDEEMDAITVLKEYSTRWKVELIHREVKQTLGIANCQCRKQRSQRNHIACSLLAYIKLKQICTDKQITIYRLKRIQLDEYMKWITKNPIFVIN
jgi:hypothetical protein